MPVDTQQNHCGGEEEAMRNEYSKENIFKCLEILDKFQFFQGQRAGRELWNDKPVEIQNEDIKNFNKDIEFIRNVLKSANSGD